MGDGAAVSPPAGVRGGRAAGKANAPGLPVGTRVRLTEGAQLAGTVVSCPRPEWSFGLLGLFGVRLDNGISQVCHATDVIVLALPGEKPISERGVLAQTG